MKGVYVKRSKDSVSLLCKSDAATDLYFTSDELYYAVKAFNGKYVFRSTGQIGVYVKTRVDDYTLALAASDFKLLQTTGEVRFAKYDIFNSDGMNAFREYLEDNYYDSVPVEGVAIDEYDSPWDPMRIIYENYELTDDGLFDYDCRLIVAKDQLVKLNDIAEAACNNVNFYRELNESDRQDYQNFLYG